jgi:carboxyl-terminal processing protease
MPRKVKHTQITKLIAVGIGVGLALGSAFLAGFVARELLLPAVTQGMSNSFYLLDEVQQLVNDHYLRPQPSESERQYAAIRGLLGSLNDRYTFFIEPAVAQSESDALAGVYGGVGVQVRRDSSGQLLMFPYNSSPASQAGIKNNDILLSINEAPIAISISVDDINQMLRGEVKEGSGVNIQYQDSSTGTVVDLFLPFAIIEVPSVVWSVLNEDTQIGYIQIILFTNRTPDELENALTSLIQQGVIYLVLDLRNNNGGLLQESIMVASYFLENVTVVVERSQSRERSVMSMTVPRRIDLPLVVLVNPNTASAAELVAVALQENDRATIIGQPSYGKGTVQQIFRLSDGSSIHVTTAEWLSPDRQQLEGVGVMPDISIQDEPDDIDQALATAIKLFRS